MLLLRMLLLVALCSVGVWFYYERSICTAIERECVGLVERSKTLRSAVGIAEARKRELTKEAGRLNRERIRLSRRVSTLLKRCISLQKEWSDIKAELAKYRILKERIDSVIRQANILLESLRLRSD